MRLNLPKEVKWMKTTIICGAIAVFFAMAARIYLLLLQRSVLQACYLVPYALSSGLYVVMIKRILAFQYWLFTQLWQVFFPGIPVFPSHQIFFIDLLWFSLIFSILNRPFYSCVLSCLAIEWKWDWSWPCFDRNLPTFLMLMLQFSC